MVRGMKTISLKVDDTLDTWLTEEAEKLGRTRSDIVRDALEQRRNGGGPATVHDLMKDYCGIIKGGPRDYATNKKHMKGFGRDRRSA